MNKYEWKDSAACLEYDTDLFFDECPVRKKCFAVGVSQKEWGVWGGIYLENGQISREFSDHRTKQSWGDTWKHLVMD
jgi:hypothetical protein